MNHELLTPLNGLLGFSELLASDPEGRLSAQQAEEVRQIQRASRTLLRLVEDALELARADARRIELRDENVDFRLIMHEVCLLIRPAAEKKGVHLQTYCDAELRCVPGDEGRLRQIISNLVSNAIKYSHAHGRNVAVCGIARQSHGVGIRVPDDGVGIREEEQLAIFQPFEHGQHVRADAGGYGIGLSIVKRLVDVMGGEITVRSEPDQGSTFRVVLPLESEWTTVPEAGGQETSDE